MPGLEIDLSIYPDEKSLLAALRRGEEDACTCLVKHFASLLYRPALQVLNDPDEAEVVVQKAFIKACEKMDTFEAKSQLKTWLYSIAKNEALMERRRRTSKKVAPIEDIETIDSDQQFMAESVDIDPMEAILTSELHVSIANALEKLPESLRSVLFLRTIQGLSTAETAAELDISESAVKVRLHRARQQISDLLKDYLEVA
ncbi:MAG: sigma-70 family RNA polymerase sigma factor [Anaerolineae bacterium]|nr:sigma-70 family RNA polymerase sigma factor [Anaerolineae bacterium]